jgi:hypothetical protein
LVASQAITPNHTHQPADPTCPLTGCLTPGIDAWPPALQPFYMCWDMCHFLRDVVAALAAEAGGDSALLQQMMFPEVAPCLVKTLDTLLGYHHTHQLHITADAPVRHLTPCLT